MENIEIDLTKEELEVAEAYASRKGISVEEAFKRALLEKIQPGICR